MRKIFCYFIFTFLIIGCQNTNQPPLKLKDFKDDIGVKELGKRLIHLPFGLNSMEARNDAELAISHAISEASRLILPEYEIVIGPEPPAAAGAQAQDLDAAAAAEAALLRYSEENQLPTEQAALELALQQEVRTCHLQPAGI